MFKKETQLLVTFSYKRPFPEKNELYLEKNKDI